MSHIERRCAYFIKQKQLFPCGVEYITKGDIFCGRKCVYDSVIQTCEFFKYIYELLDLIINIDMFKLSFIG